MPEDHHDWPHPVNKEMAGWRRLDWNEIIMHGDCWCHANVLTKLPNPFTTNPMELAKYYVSDYPGKAVAGYAIEDEHVYGSYEIWRICNSKRTARRLKMNPIFSKPLPLP